MPNGKRFQNPWIMDFNRPVSIHQWMFWGAHELEKDVSVPLTQLQSLFLVDLHRWFFFTHGSCFVEDPSQLGSGHQVGQITDMCIHVCNVMQRNVVQCNMMPCNSQWNLKKCSKHLLENLGLAPLAPPPYKQEWDPHMAGIIPPPEPLQSRPTTFCQVVGGPWNEPDMQQSSCAVILEGTHSWTHWKSWGAHTHLARYWVFSWLLTWVLNELPLSWLKRWKRILIHY